MRLPALLPSPATVCVQTLNALLARESWARARLSRHVGKTFRLELGPWAVLLSVVSEGAVAVAAGQAQADVVLSVPTDQLANLPAALAARDPARLSALLRIQGEA